MKHIRNLAVFTVVIGFIVGFPSVFGTVSSTGTSTMGALGSSSVTIGFPFQNNTNVTVYLEPTHTLLEYGAGANKYLITGGNPGTTVTANSGVAASEQLLLKRIMPITQTVDYQPNTAFPANSHENQMDKQIYIMQQLQEQIDAGIPGPQGIQGDPGPTGATGASSVVPGPQGDTGPAGATGASSVVPGPQGIQGDPGPTGATGATGAAGSSGICGGVLGTVAEIGASAATCSSFSSCQSTLSNGDQLCVRKGTHDGPWYVTKELGIVGTGHGSKVGGSVVFQSGSSFSSVIGLRFLDTINIDSGVSAVAIEHSWTGASTLPVDNGTGNYINVIQE